MKLFLLLSLFFCTYQQAYGTTTCIQGIEMGDQAAGKTTCPVTDSCSLITGTVTQNGISMNIKIGQCILTAACSFVKCNAITSYLPASMADAFQNCRATCCKNGDCTELPNDGGLPIVPYGPVGSVPENPVPEQMPSFPNTCPLPLWNSRLEDNWSGVLGRSGRPTPKFELVSKKLDKQGGYKAGKKYKFLIRSLKHKRISRLLLNGFYITLQSTTGTSDCGCKEEGAAMCPVGSFITSRIRIAGAPVVQPGCDDPIVMDYPARNLKKSVMEWRAPACTDAVIVMKAVVRGSDNRLYQDNDELEMNNQFLTKVIKPRPKKPKKPKKPKRPKTRRE